MSDSDDCDWFDKDEDALMRDFERNMKAKEAERMEEHIKVPTNTLGELLQCNLKLNILLSLLTLLFR